ncbi:MAG: Ig-like domain-containing protein, partial [Flavisolibacter sp.]
MMKTQNFPRPKSLSFKLNSSTLQFISFKWLALVLLVFAAGCKKVSEEPGMVGICPEVVSTDPANGAVNVATIKDISATFNEAMDPASLNANTVFVKQGSNLVSGTISYSGNTVTFNPTGPLAANTVYTGTITTGAKDPAGNAMVADYVWSFNTGNVPIVVSTDPVNGAVNVVLNKIISATFSTAMNAATVNATTFTLKQGVNTIAGTISYSGLTANFTPLLPLDPNTVYTAMISTGAKDTEGNSLAANHTWSFATGSVPSVVSTDPANTATGVALNKRITASFSEAMNAATINTTTFLLNQGNTPITGTVSYLGTTATFTPSANLEAGKIYTATITTGAKNPGGNSIAADYVWSFTTAGNVVPPPSILGSAAMFGVFGGSAGITNSGLNTVINNGSIGTTGASTLITGFHDGTTGDIYTETPLNVGLVTGRIYTAPPAPGNATSFAIAQQGLLDAISAYNSISPASRPGGTDPGAGELGGLTLAPGVYKSASGTFNISNGNLTLDAMGDPNAEWIFQTASGLTVGIAGPAGARSVNLINGAQAKNVYWHVGSAATINGAGGGVMTGTIIASAGVTFSTAGNATQTVLNGRALSLNASVTMVNTTVNVQ